MAEVEDGFGGNICRCTGYRPILDAMKSFAVDSSIEVPAECVDIEDSFEVLCPRTGQCCSGSCARPSLPAQNNCHWYWPKTLAELFEALAQVPTGEEYILVAGNTAHGVYRRPRSIRHYVDVNMVPELKQHSFESEHLLLGANLTLTETMQLFRQAQQRAGFEYCAQLWQHFNLIANVPVRNVSGSHKYIKSSLKLVSVELLIRLCMETESEMELIKLEFYRRNFKFITTTKISFILRAELWQAIFQSKRSTRSFRRMFSSHSRPWMHMSWCTRTQAVKG